MKSQNIQTIWNDYIAPTTTISLDYAIRYIEDVLDTNHNCDDAEWLNLLKKIAYEHRK